MPPLLAWARDLKTKQGKPQVDKNCKNRPRRPPPPNPYASRPSPEPTQLAGDGGDDEDKPLPKSNSIQNADPYRICPFEFSPCEIAKKSPTTLLVKLYKYLSLSVCKTHLHFSRSNALSCAERNPEIVRTLDTEGLPQARRGQGDHDQVSGKLWSCLGHAHQRLPDPVLEAAMPPRHLICALT